MQQTTPIERLFVRDRVAFGRSSECMRAWSSDRMAVAPGEAGAMGGRDALARRHAWALGEGLA